MIILNTVNKNVSLVTAANVLGSLSVKVGWTDDSTTPAYFVTPVSVSATEITIAPAPGSGVSRAIKSIDIVNNNLVQPAMLTINKNVSGTPTLLYKTELFPGETLKFSSRRGWYKLDSSGVILELTTDPDFSRIIDDTSTTNVVSQCRALPGADPSEPVWAISLFDTSTGLGKWADGTNQFKNVANNRVSLTYK